jgi:cytochrome P450
VIDFFSDEVRRNPYPLYDRLRRASPLFPVPGTGLWMILDYEGVKHVLSDHVAFSSRYGPEWLIFFDPPRHTKLRALITRAFTPRVVANLEPRVRGLSRVLLDQTIERGEMDLANEFSVPLPFLVIGDMLGIPAADRPRFTRWNDAILNMSYTILDRGETAKAATREFGAVTLEMNDYVAHLVAERQARPVDDLLTRLMQAEGGW